MTIVAHLVVELGHSGTRFIEELDGFITWVFGDSSGTHVREAVYGDGSRTC